MNPPAMGDFLIMKKITTLLNCYERSLQLLFPIVIHQQTNYFVGVNKYCCVMCLMPVITLLNVIHLT